MLIALSWMVDSGMLDVRELHKDRRPKRTRFSRLRWGGLLGLFERTVRDADD